MDERTREDVIAGARIVSAGAGDMSLKATTAMIASIIATLVFAVYISQNLVEREEEPRPERVEVVSPLETMRTGVRATITAGDVTITRSLSALSFSLEPGQSLDARLPAGPMTAVLTVRFDPGLTAAARIGAQVLGGEVVIRRDGEIIASDASADEPVEILSSPIMPIRLRRSMETLEYEVRWNGNRPLALRAIWQPTEPFASRSKLLLPSDGARLIDDDALLGRLLVTESNCASCHRSENAVRQQHLTMSSAPLLDRLASRTNPDWFRKWIMSPHDLKPGTRMPSVSNRLQAEDIEHLVAFLYSNGAGTEPESRPLDPSLISTGRVLYHDVGCVACHGPLESLAAIPGGLSSDLEPWRAYEPLGPLAMKMDVNALAAFLEDPLKSRRSGLMPSMQLTSIEAKAIASYLIDQTGGAMETASDHQLPSSDAARVDAGRKVFSGAGCANCHAMNDGIDELPILTDLSALESLSAALDAGCLAESPDARAPMFAIHPFERDAIRTYLSSLESEASHDVPIDALSLEMTRFNCTACHSMHAWRGPEAAISVYFGAGEETDLGDEGRLPPSLTDAGTRLTTSWMHTILSDETRARPYLNVRMPGFGDANTSHLPQLIASASGARAIEQYEPEFNQERTTAGRRLVGSKGLNCIQCHNIAGHPSTGTPGPDLAIMTGRLKYEFFDRWLSDPSFIVPGTRMPSFFAGTVSPVGDVLMGNPEQQIDAIWSYLSQGESLPLPEGLPDPTGLELVVHDEPIVFRTFMKDAGIRAIACGYPEQIHCAFDADRCELALIWRNHFLSAAGAWASRGGSETNPQEVLWRAPNEPVISFDDESSAQTRRGFIGYTLDDKRRPIFEYEMEHAGVSVIVRDQPLPVLQEGELHMIRRFEVEGPTGTKIAIQDVGEQVVLQLDESGRAVYEVGIVW